jgi:hypothetical protein
MTRKDFHTQLVRLTLDTMVEHHLAYKTDTQSYALTPKGRMASKANDAAERKALLKMIVELGDEALSTDVDLERVHECLSAMRTCAEACLCSLSCDWEEYRDALSALAPSAPGDNGKPDDAVLH